MKNRQYIPLKVLVMLMSTYLFIPYHALANTEKNNLNGPSEKRSEIMSMQLDSHQLSINAQDKVDQLDDHTALALQEFQNILREIELTQKYNQNLAAQISHQENQLKTIMEQRVSLVQVRKKLDPTMNNMITVLNDFVAEDVPFLWQERQLRIKALKATKNNPDITISEKIRRILEAYQIEVSYGYDIESWQEPLPHGKSTQLVTLLRIGRVALYYLTPDKQEGGVWDQQNRVWLTLPNSDINNVITAMKVANSEASPQLLSLPVIAPALAEVTQ